MKTKRKLIFYSVGLVIFLTIVPVLSRQKKLSFGKRAYVKKGPIAGYCKPSKVNSRTKTKITSGYWKRDSKLGGYATYVNPYARSW